MRRQIKWISELGGSFDTPKEAFDDEGRLPSIIATYEADLVKMETTGEFNGSTDDIEGWIDTWKDAIAIYKAKWVKARPLGLDKFTEPE
jgi:hypothetical protein